MISLDDIIASAVVADIVRAQVEAFCKEQDSTLHDFYNRAALTIAKRFHDGLMSYDDADIAMNRFWHLMIDDAVKFGNDFQLPEPAYSIYCAFDAGEYGHGDGADP